MCLIRERRATAHILTATRATAATLGDGVWVLAGHKAPVNSVVGDRWARVWYLDKTGGLDALLAFSFSDAGLDFPPGMHGLLYYSPTDPYAFRPLPLTGTLEGDRLIFAVPDALLRPGYYTLELVPEPATLSLLALGALALLRRRRTA